MIHIRGMKKIIWFLLLLALVGMFYSTAFSQKDKALDKYKHRTLLEITAFNHANTDEILRKSKLEDQQDFIGVDFFYSRVRVQYLGTPRPISPDHKDLIRTWAKLQNVDQKITSLYEDEFLFKECDKEYWIPMQKKVGEDVLKEIKAKDMITLFVIHVGGRKARMSKEYDWLFLSIEFEK